MPARVEADGNGALEIANAAVLAKKGCLRLARKHACGREASRFRENLAKAITEGGLTTASARHFTVDAAKLREWRNSSWHYRGQGCSPGNDGL